MNIKNLILASGSPRRQELLKHITTEFSVITSEADETFDEGLAPSEAVKQIAKKKALTVYESHKDCTVIGADTIVVIDGEILGKPKNIDDARIMLHKLSGKTHTVYTGVFIISPKSQNNFVCETSVVFDVLSDCEIDEYIGTGEPFDKAGAYGIQGYGSKFINEINGDYFNVMGFPVSRIYNALKNYNYKNIF